MIPEGDPSAWKPKLFGEDGPTGAFQAADGTTVTVPVLPVAVPFHALVTFTPDGRFMVTCQLLIDVEELTVTLATKPVLHALTG